MVVEVERTINLLPNKTSKSVNRYGRSSLTNKTRPGSTVFKINSMKEDKKANSHFDFIIKNKILPKSKRSQVTIFIIFALIVVVLIVLMFILREPEELELISIENPQAFIDTCARDSINEAINILRIQGGEIEPEGSVMFKGREITYLCYTTKFYTPCTNQKPSLIEDIQDEITSYIYPRISNCFNTLKTESEKLYSVEMDEGMEIDIQLKSGRIIANIEKDFRLSKEDRIDEYNNFRIEIIDPLFDLSKIAMEIANQESEFCNFDALGFMIIYPKYNLDKLRTGDSDIIYTIRGRKTNKEFVFAVRTCVLPAGF